LWWNVTHDSRPDPRGRRGQRPVDGQRLIVGLVDGNAARPAQFAHVCAQRALRCGICACVRGMNRNGFAVGIGNVDFVLCRCSSRCRQRAKMIRSSRASFMQTPPAKPGTQR
jgi:hypothetical protein